MSLLARTTWLFDLDGTLVDTNGLHAAAYRHALSTLWPDGLETFEYDRFKGVRSAEVFDALGAPGDIAPVLVAEKQAAYRRLVEAGEADVCPGARDVLAMLAARGAALYVVTGASRRGAGLVLEKTGLARFFAGVVTGDDVTRGKPDPLCYRHCIEQYRLDPAACVVVEDATSGVEAAHAAGLPVIGVGIAADLDFPALTALREAL